jgi:hypothetical protein
MTMIDTAPQARLEEDGEDLAASFAAMERRLQHGFADTLEEWEVEVALPWIKEHWPREGWAPLAPSTIQEKTRLGEPLTALIRVREAKPHLYEAATSQNAPGHVSEVSGFELITGVSESVFPYAEALHDGSGRLPARPWDDLDGPPMEELDRRIQATIEGEK